MSEAVEKKSCWTPIKVGLVLTGMVFALFFLMAFQNNCLMADAAGLECKRNWEWFLTSRPNEIGDTLAGFAGTLAFVWIVVTVWLQSNELAEQREVLREQKEEFKLMVAAQNAQVIALQMQAEVLRDERMRRDEAAEERFILARIETVSRNFNTRVLIGCSWRLIQTDANSKKFSKVVDLQAWLHFPIPETDLELLLPRLPEALQGCKREIKGAIESGAELVECPDNDIFFEALELLDGLQNHIQRLGSASGERFVRLRLEELVLQLRDYISSDELWSITA